MTVHIRLRRDTAADWTAANPVLALGEPGVETDTRQIKYGDGATAWNSLPYAAGGGGGAVASVNGRTGAVSSLAEAADLATEVAARAAAVSGLVPLLEHQTSLGSPSIVAGSVVMDVTSKWGISGGSVYFDDGGATADEEAILLFDSTGALSWLPANEVHA